MPERDLPVSTPLIPLTTPAINQPVGPQNRYRVLPFAAVAAVLLVSGLAFGSYQLGKGQVSVPYSTTADPTANWKTYTDSRFAISFRYPSDLIMKEPISDFGIYTVHFTRGTEWLSLNVESGKVFNSLEDFVKNRYEAPLHTYRETQAAIIGDISWFVLRGTFAGMRTMPFNQTVTLKNGVAYSLGFGSDDQNKIEENNSTLIKILSTFKFNIQEPEGSFCGGFAGVPCDPGYKCQLDGNYPDAGGICVIK